MPQAISRREFLVKGGCAISYAALGGLMAGCVSQESVPPATAPAAMPISTRGSAAEEKPIVSIVKIKRNRINAAVEEAIDLLGGMETVASGKNRIMLKPNLTSDDPDATTKPAVIKALAQLMRRAGKEVWIGEGTAAAGGFNAIGDEVYRATNQDVLDRMQQYVFDELGYTDLARKLDIPLVNLHSGEMVTAPVPDGYVFDAITMHRSLQDIDLLCSVPMMKTHVLATVTLGMKNLIGLYPGTVYCSVRACVHDRAADAGSPGIAFEILDMVRANKLGLVVIDGSMAMEGNGPTDGELVKMDVIIAGANPLATDLVAANVMGFEPHEVPTFVWANKAGMQPQALDEIEVRGAKIEEVRRNFVRPTLYPWSSVRTQWGVREMP